MRSTTGTRSGRVYPAHYQRLDFTFQSGLELKEGIQIHTDLSEAGIFVQDDACGWL